MGKSKGWFLSPRAVKKPTKQGLPATHQMYSEACLTVTLSKLAWF